MPPLFQQLAAETAELAGFTGFTPDACLINRYTPGVGMGLHQDRDEQDFSAPIVSISLGLPVIFLWGGLTRGDKARPIVLHHGDTLIWGGEDRLRFHGVRPLKPGSAAVGQHPPLNDARINLTFRKAG
ncbi:MAG TPA: alpha-ketoglutarate-dependent dioxygenase AlkB [Halothiobacillus sp.]|nr:alpha-ketoglutarate-dependent dioxygenase AlkB [Halothiobacillus sp.]